jgi:hypothetical protein
VPFWATFLGIPLLVTVSAALARHNETALVTVMFATSPASLVGGIYCGRFAARRFTDDPGRRVALGALLSLLFMTIISTLCYTGYSSVTGKSAGLF